MPKLPITIACRSLWRPELRNGGVTMAQNSKLRPAGGGESGFRFKQGSPVRRAQTSTRLLWRGRGARRDLARINEKYARKETRCFPRVAGTLLGLAVALSGGVLASIDIALEKSFPSQSMDRGEVLISSISEALSGYVRTVAPALNVRNHDNIGRQNQVAQLSLRPGLPYTDAFQNIDFKQSTSFPTDLNPFTAATHPYPAETAFAPKGELGHEYWRAISGPSKLIERYELYLRAHPSGILADTAIERIMDLSRVRE